MKSHSRFAQNAQIPLLKITNKIVLYAVPRTLSSNQNGYTINKQPAYHKVGARRNATVLHSKTLPIFLTWEIWRRLWRCIGFNSNKAVRWGIFGRFSNFDKCQLEAAGDVISGMALDCISRFSTDLPASFGDSQLNSGRIIRLVLVFVRRDEFCTPSCSI